MIIHFNNLLLFCLAILPQQESSSQLKFKEDGDALELTGRVIEQTQNENVVIFQTPAGRLRSIDKALIESQENVAVPFQPISEKQYGQQLRAELGDGFKLHNAGNFVLVYDTEKTYARWVAGLYRKFERGFKAYWLKSKFKLESKPEFPLAVIIFSKRVDYERYMAEDLGSINNSIFAYYNRESNRVIMYDLTSEFGNQGNRQINQVLSNPRAAHMVATIIHEATHQLMFNYGMQIRYSDMPLWLNEGMAMFFETPDLNAERGWRTIGKLNFLRLDQFMASLNDRPQDSLRDMLSSDDEFRSESALNSYAQAWAFNYFLLKKHKKTYVAYLKHLSKKVVLNDTPEGRLADFEQFFDTPLEELDRQFVTYFQRLKR